MTDPAGAVRYRQHAEELRAISKDIRDAPARLALISFANDFDRIAESVEADSGVNTPLKRHG